MSRSPAQAETAQDSDRKESKARSRDLASISAPRLERGSDQAAPLARVDGLEPRMKCLPPRGRTAGHLSGSDRATRCPTGNSPPRGATPVGQGRLAVSIPIVMASAIDPVGRGFVASLAHPGGNITGLASSLQDTASKQVALLTMALPDLTRIGAAVHPDSGSVLVLDAARSAAKNAGREFVAVEIRSPDEMASAFATLADQHVDAIMVITSAFFISQRERIAEIARKLRMPTIFAEREYMEAGGLMSYGESIYDFYRRAAFYVDKIFKGAKPSELPVQQPTRFFLAINRKTADAIGFTIPLQLLVAADEVIE